MKENKIKCCICGKEIKEIESNNPYGAMYKDDNGNPQEMRFEDYERCCNECNELYVIPGRMYSLFNKKK